MKIDVRVKNLSKTKVVREDFYVKKDRQWFGVYKLVVEIRNGKKTVVSDSLVERKNTKEEALKKQYELFSTTRDERVTT